MVLCDWKTNLATHFYTQIEMYAGNGQESMKSQYNNLGNAKHTES